MPSIKNGEEIMLVLQIIGIVILVCVLLLFIAIIIGYIQNSSPKAQAEHKAFMRELTRQAVLAQTEHENSPYEECKIWIEADKEFYNGGVP